MVTRAEEVTTTQLVEETIKKVVDRIRDNILNKEITEAVVQVEEDAIEENLIKVIFNATIAKSMTIIQVNVEEARKIKKSDAKLAEDEVMLMVKIKEEERFKDQ